MSNITLEHGIPTDGEFEVFRWVLKMFIISRYYTAARNERQDPYASLGNK